MWHWHACVIDTPQSDGNNICLFLFIYIFVVSLMWAESPLNISHETQVILQFIILFTALHIAELSIVNTTIYFTPES